MAEDAILPDLLIESLHCPVCFHCYDDPRNLPCQHTFCRECIQKMASRGALTCPLCNTAYGALIGTEEFPKNFALCNVLDCLCQDCKLRLRADDCQFCEKGLCVSCASSHNAHHNMDATRALSDLEDSVNDIERENVEIQNSTAQHADRVKAQIQGAFHVLRTSLDEKERQLIEEVHESVHQAIDSPWQKQFRQHLATLREFQIQVQSSAKQSLQEAGCMPMSDLRDLQNKISHHKSHLADLRQSLPTVPRFSFTYSSQEVLEPLTSFGSVMTSTELDKPHNLSRPLSLDYLPSQAAVYTVGKHIRNDVQTEDLKHPWGVAASPEGTIVVTDSETCKVYIFNDDELVLSFGGRGRGDGQFYRPRGVAISHHGNIYVADSYNNRVQSFDPKGVYCGSFGKKGSAAGLLNQPTGLAVDAYGYVYVCDSYNYRVQVFQEDGTFVRTFGSKGQSSHQFSSIPSNVAVSHTGKVLVSDMTDTVKIYNNEGDFLQAVDVKPTAGFKTAATVVGVCVDAAGNFILASEQGLLMLLPEDGTTVRSLRDIHDSDDVTCCVRGVSYSAEGVIHVCDCNRRTVTAWQTTLHY